MVSWELVRWLHLLAMAFFVGGQLVLVAAVLPSLRGEDGREPLRAIARRFGWGSLAALVVLLVTGAAMAGHFGRWSDGTLQLKLALVALVFVLTGLHVVTTRRRAVSLTLVAVSVVIVYLGVELAHG
jgi:uncharacterized membrane protein